MFTIKYVDHNGIESISECAYVVADRTHNGAARVMVFDESPSETGDNNSGVYVERMEARDGDLPQKLYVMNRFGATVATYRF